MNIYSQRAKIDVAKMGGSKDLAGREDLVKAAGLLTFSVRYQIPMSHHGWIPHLLRQTRIRRDSTGSSS